MNHRGKVPGSQQSSFRAPPRLTIRVGAHYLASVGQSTQRASSASSHHLFRLLFAYLHDLREKEPLILVRLECLAHEHRVPLTLGGALKRKRYQIPETSCGDSRLRWKHPVVGRKRERFVMSHTLAYDCASQISRQGGRYGLIEENPGMAAIAGARPFHGYRNSQALRRVPIGRDRLLPSRFVEIGHEHRCLVLAIEDIKTYNILKGRIEPFEMVYQLAIAQRRERPRRTTGALRPHVLALRTYPANPLVGASWRIGDASIFAPVTVGVHILAAFEQTSEQPQLL